MASYCATGVSTLLLLVYPRTAATIFATFNCDTFTIGDGSASLRYLHEDLSIDCASASHLAFRGYASIMIGVFPVGIPAVFAILLWRERRPIAALAMDVKRQHAVERTECAAVAPGGLCEQRNIAADVSVAADAVSELAAEAARRESAVGMPQQLAEARAAEMTLRRISRHCARRFLHTHG